MGSAHTLVGNNDEECSFPMTLKTLIKGWVGEAQSTLAKKIFLDPKTYLDLNNVTIPILNFSFVRNRYAGARRDPLVIGYVNR